MRPPRHPAVVALLRLPALAYAVAVRWRNGRFDRAGSSRRSPIPVVSVGNITVGGTGKTPLVAWLARRVTELGRTPAILSRGYGGRAGSGPRLVADAGGPKVGPDISGDEPYLFHRLVPEAIVVAGADRVASARAAAELGADIAILDDGFQHRRLARDLDVVVLDGKSPLGNGLLLPAGILREPASSLARADLVVAHRAPDDEALAVVRDLVRAHNPRCPVVASSSERLGFFDLDGARTGRPGRVLAFCGIGRPDAFLDDLLREGLELVALRVFDDHHPYTPKELRALRDEAVGLGAALVTTEKDLARLAAPRLREDAERIGPIALRIATTLATPGPLLTPLRGLLGEPA